MTEVLMTIDHARKSYGGLHAVDIGEIEVRANTITALIGPNGAGKSTLFNMVSGFERADEGEWTFNGQDISRCRSHEIARRGLVRTFQLTRSLESMTVLENMLFALSRHPGEKLSTALMPWRWRQRESEGVDKARDLLNQFGLDAKRDEYAGGISGGQRKLLEIARALMTDPIMVMLDEPMAGVNPALSMRIQQEVLRLKEAGLTVLFVEHDMAMVRRISDEVVVMASGRRIAQGDPETVMSDPGVINAYLGAHHNVSLRELL